VTGFWTVVVMPDGVLVPQLGRNSHAADTAAVEEKRETVKQGGAESNADERAHLRDTAHKSLAYVQFV
jgi:hypothetical protein